jgi:hypothetical protein
MAKQPMRCAALLIASSAMTLFGQVVFSDGTFSNSAWSITSKIVDTSAGQTATFNAFQQPSGGNPGNFRETDMTFSGLIIVSQLNSQFTYTPSTQGPIGSISISYDLLETNPPFVGAAVGYAALLYQNGTYYIPNSAIDAITAGGWQHFQHSGLAASSFTKAYGSFTLPGAGPANPDFSSAGAPIQIGYITSNSVPGPPPITTQSGIDNFAMTVTPASGPPATPAPSTLVLMLTGLAGLYLVARACRATGNRAD